MQPAKPNEILLSFNLPDAEFEVREVKQGLINDTFLVLQDQRIEYVLQRINTAVFKDPVALMGNLQKALPFLQATDYRALRLVDTREGNNYLDTGNAGCWRLMNYIPGSITHNTTNNPKTAFEAGRILGRFHSLLQEAGTSDFASVIPGFHKWSLRFDQYNKALNSGSTERLALAQKAIKMVAGLLDDPPLPNSGKLPKRLCHNDTKLNNILFSSYTGEALCLIDLDTLMEGYFLYDFGDAVRTIVNTAPEDERIISRISFSRPLFAEFVKGLAQHPGLLTKNELKSLPKGAIYMPLLHGLRALTDYLSGDQYYQVAYEGQNLDRSVSLLTFAQRAQVNVGFMEKVIAEYLR
jgi:hypothetical protein